MDKIEYVECDFLIDPEQELLAMQIEQECKWKKEEEEALVHVKKNEYFCGLCKGFVPLSSFPHPHLGE